jgi:hypothetical protein
MLPFMLPPIAAAIAELQRRPFALAGALALVVVGVVVYSLSTATFPYWPGASDHCCDPLRDPLYEMAARLVLDGGAAPSVGSAIGVSGLAGLVPYFALVFGVVGAAIAGLASARGLALAIGIAAWLLAALSFVPHGGPAAEHAYRDVVLPAVQQE